VLIHYPVKCKCLKIPATTLFKTGCKWQQAMCLLYSWINAQRTQRPADDASRFWGKYQNSVFSNRSNKTADYVIAVGCRVIYSLDNVTPASDTEEDMYFRSIGKRLPNGWLTSSSAMRDRAKLETFSCNIQRYSQNNAQNCIFGLLYVRIVRNASGLFESFNAKKLRSRVSSRVCQFCS